MRAQTVEVGEVRPFREVAADKAQALKPLEEAAEVYAAWQDWREACRRIEAFARNEQTDYKDRCYRRRDDARMKLLDECADTVQAVCNLLAALGVVDVQTLMGRCERRNRERGRM